MRNFSAPTAAQLTWLRRRAEVAGDSVRVAICEIALMSGEDPHDYPDSVDFVRAELAAWGIGPRDRAAALACCAVMFGTMPAKLRRLAG